MNSLLLAFIFLALMFPGIAGAFLPIPGLLYMLILAIVFGFTDGFLHLTQNEVIILAVIALISVVNDYFSGILGAKYGGANRKSMAFGFIGMLIGIFILPPFGGLPGIFAGILVAELWRHGSEKRAVKAATGGLIGSLIGMIVTLVLSIAFLFTFIIFAIK